ncbi:hypothetical protein PG5_01510 [Pseudomonas sp. G5(2012)]|nr:hypothetical protein PG5_01510 [Pseudomonas sp. G5(2012)]
MLLAALYMGEDAMAQALRPPVLDQPSIINPRASQGVMLSITRAGERLVAVGERGQILLSDDSGHSWVQASVPANVALTAVQFIDQQQGWAVGHLGVVLHTQDAGQTWEKQLDGMQIGQLYLSQAQGSAEAVRERLLKDAQRLVEDGADKPLLDVFFSDSQNGFVVGAYNLFLRTYDGGKTWTPWSQAIANPQAYHLNSLLQSGGSLYIAGERGLLLRSRDNGNSFQPIDFPYDGSLFGIVASLHGELVAYGLRGTAFWSADQGNSWQRIETTLDSAFSSATALADGSLLLATQTGDLLVNAPGSPQFKPVPEARGVSTAAVAMSPAGEVVIAGLNGLVREGLGASASAR